MSQCYGRRLLQQAPNILVQFQSSFQETHDGLEEEEFRSCPMTKPAMAEFAIPGSYGRV